MSIFCPKCKNELKNDNEHYSCPKCEFDFFFGPPPAAGIILINDKKQIYLNKRAREPKMGFWGLPGGFINLHESAEDGARREAKEELGIDLGEITFFKSYVNDYLYKGTQYYPLDLFFIAPVKKDKIKPGDIDEFTEGKFFDCDKIPFADIAFTSQKQVLKDYLEFSK
jgi:NAD+ diphosphatase